MVSYQSKLNGTRIHKVFVDEQTVINMKKILIFGVSFLVALIFSWLVIAMAYSAICMQFMDSWLCEGHGENALISFVLLSGVSFVILSVVMYKMFFKVRN